MGAPDKGRAQPDRRRGSRPQTEEKYREAIELYRSTRLSCAEISRIYGVTASVLRGYISKHHRDLMLARYNIVCNREEARHIKLQQLRGQLPATHAKYKAAIEACDKMDFIEFNVSQIARMFGLDGSGLGRQLRTHYPEILEFREKERARLGINDNLPRGTRPFCKEQYAEAVKLLNSNSYITLQEVADSCGVSYTGLEQHLLFYHKELVKKRIGIREKALGQQLKGKITGRGTVHSPSPKAVEKYAEAVHLYRTTPMSIAQIAKKTQVSTKGLYGFLQTWHQDLICQRNEIPYEEGKPVDWSKVRKYNPATKAKYAEAIARLRESELPTTTVAAEFGLHPECFRAYLKEHEPELYARKGMVKTDNGGTALGRSMEKYDEAIRLYGTTTESLKSLAGRFGVNACSLRQFIERHFPELIEQRQELLHAEAIRKLKESELPINKVAAELGLRAKDFRQYLKEHEPELYAREDKVKIDRRSMIFSRSMAKYGEAVHLYATTTETLKSLASRFGVNACSLRQFIQWNFPELIERRQKMRQQAKQDR